MGHPKQIAFVGTGGRANGYTSALNSRHLKVVACADPSASNRQTFLGLQNLVGRVKEFDDWREMFDHTPNLDGVIITTPNHQHTEPAIEAMKRGFILALGKPIAHTPGNCRQLLHAHRLYNARVLVGFVMRSTPFYLQAKHWIENGTIGGVVSIQADELPEVFVTATMFRSDWRRFKHLSGGSCLKNAATMSTW